MKKTYAELDLKKIRDDCGLDFARHTYSPGQCSCCYGPEDMGKKWWAKGKKPKKIITKRDSSGKPCGYKWDRDINRCTFILFNNADNGSGPIKSLEEPIENYTYVSYNVSSREQLDKVCAMLQEQLGTDYLVEKPKNECYSICIYYGKVYSAKDVWKMIKERDYRLRKGLWFYYNSKGETMEAVKFDATMRKKMDCDTIHFV